MNNLELDTVVSKLMPMIEDGNCIVWVGSGLSKSSEYPDWKETVRKLCDICEVTRLGTSEEELPDKLIDKAEECKKADIDVYHNTLANLFGRQPVNTRFAYTLLMKLQFKAYVTTNFDPLLSQGGILEGYDKIFSYPLIPHELDNYHPIVYLHGCARLKNRATGKDLILARSDFDEAYEDIGIANDFLRLIIGNYPLIFLGCSLREPVIREAFEKVYNIHTRIKRAHPDRSLPKRYIVLPTERPVSESSNEGMEQAKSKEKVENNRIDEMGIEVIRYKPDDWDTHGEIEYILTQLWESTKNSKGAFESEEMP